MMYRANGEKGKRGLPSLGIQKKACRSETQTFEETVAFCGDTASEENTGFACAGNCKPAPTAVVEKKQHSPVLRSPKGPQADESKLWTIAELDPYLPASRATVLTSISRFLSNSAQSQDGLAKYIYTQPASRFAFHDKLKSVSKK